MLPHAPGVQMQAIPEDALDVEMEDAENEDKANPEERISIRASEKRVQNDNELSDSEDEGADGRKDVRLHKVKGKKPKLESVADAAKVESAKQSSPAATTQAEAKVENGDSKQDASPAPESSVTDNGTGEGLGGAAASLITATGDDKK